MKVCVVGGGINGIASAYRIKETFPNLSVTIITKDVTPDTTSDIAAGWWEPYLTGNTHLHLIHRWSKSTYDYAHLSLNTHPKAAREQGISTRHGVFLSTQPDIKDPFWHDIVYDYHRLNKKDLERYPASIKSGFGFTSVFIEGGKFLPILYKRFKESGGTIIKREIQSFKELYNEYDVIINCAGLANRHLLNDKETFPIRGQIIRVKAPWINEYCIINESDDPNYSTYILPNQDFVVLGGTQYENDWNINPTAKDKQWIIESTKKFIPNLEFAEHMCDCVGLRPARTSIRVEREDINYAKDKKIKMIHNYGHGGSGLTLFWGCAQDVLVMFTQIINESNISKL